MSKYYIEFLKEEFENPNHSIEEKQKLFREEKESTLKRIDFLEKCKIAFCEEFQIPEQQRDILPEPSPLTDIAQLNQEIKQNKSFLKDLLTDYLQYGDFK
jgi:hypothetical protein